MSTSFPHITAATAAVLAILQVLLALHAARGRGRYKVGLGDGGNAHLLQRIRAHGNLAENAPIFLILLGLTKMSGQQPIVVAGFAAVFLVSRFSHALGLLISSGLTPFRFLGVIGTVVCDVGLAFVLGNTLARDLHWLDALPHF